MPSLAEVIAITEREIEMKKVYVLIGDAEYAGVLRADGSIAYVVNGVTKYIDESLAYVRFA